MTEFHKIWIEQCEAAEGIKERYGAQEAARYLIAEKLLRFMEASHDHADFAAVNAANEFAGHVLDFPDLIPFNNQLADLQEEYMPSYPPMSPVTSAFFASWLVLDARDSKTDFTIGELLVRYLQHTGMFDYFRKAMVALNDSCCSFYEVTEVDAQGMVLWDIVCKREFRAWSSNGYQGRPGEVWYVRLMPPFVEGAFAG